MDVPEFVSDIVSIYSLDTIDLSNYGFSVSSLIHGLITTGSISALAATLSIDNRKLESIIRRNITPKFNKPHSAKWSKYLLSLAYKAICTQCNIVKDIDEFYPDRHQPSGHTTWCMSCSALWSATKYATNPGVREAKSANSKLHYNTNKSNYISRNIARKLHIETATPQWADLGAIKEIYAKCPIGYHVDHIIPLRGTNVCGLHVESNLQYLLAKDNIRKSNKFIDLVGSAYGMQTDLKSVATD